MSLSLFNVFEQIAQENGWEFKTDDHNVFLCSLHKNGIDVDVLSLKNVVLIGVRRGDHVENSRVTTAKLADPESIDKIVTFLRGLHE